MVLVINYTKCFFCVIPQAMPFAPRLQELAASYVKIKVGGMGQAKVLSKDELKRLFTEGLLTPRDRSLSSKKIAPLKIWNRNLGVAVLIR